MLFWSDNQATVCPEILAAVERANEGAAKAYGADRISARLNALFSEVFETDVTVFPVAIGTAANALAMALLARSYGAVFCHEEADIHTHACGAPEFYTGGAKMVPVGGAEGRVDAAALTAAIDAHPVGFVHGVQPAAITVAQATECGTVYDAGALAELGVIARDRGLGFHIDGARSANAVVSTGASPADLTWRAGVDILSFGAIKNGGLGAEAVVVFDAGLAEHVGYLQKRGGHLSSKARFLAAQLEAYLAGDLWLRNAAHANGMARRLADGLAALGFDLAWPAQANAVFVTLSEPAIEALEAEGAGFYRWGKPDPATVRLVCSFETTEEQIDAFLAALDRAMGEQP